MSTENQLALLQRIDERYRALTGRGLYCPDEHVDRYLWLHEHAPYSILAHSSEADPVFVYANRCALSCFKYSLEEMLQLPSRLSAGPSDREARQHLLDIVKRDGIATGYSGPRVDKQGKSFIIYEGEVWQSDRDAEAGWGQAALFWPCPRNGMADIT
ncbi:MEKHLA domain-containing protein [Pantoea allii]|uniref:MEKHLA domain-containing protein n=1 Tax=Pantoea allii TaxID=574096 RepID=UPI00155FD0DF|nr:MEKHLA domain-containing protein [Pantoea allii]NQS85537.1 MEKHLA domain-containing protein [Pantoea allii]